MLSEKKTLFGVALLFLLIIFSTVLFMFSISIAEETEAEAPAVPEEAVSEEGVAEEIVSEAVEPEDVIPADPVAEEDPQDPVPNEGPLTVLKNGVAATTPDDYEWDGDNNLYKIKVSGLTFKGSGEEEICAISNEGSNKIESITFDNVRITSSKNNGTVYLFSAENLTINIVGSCSIANTLDKFAYGFNIEGDGGILTINGDSSSNLVANAIDDYSFFIKNFTTNIITGGVSINATSTNSVTLWTGADYLIFDTTGKITFYGTNPDCNAIWGDSDNFNMKVNKGFLELHGGNDLSVEGSAICTRNEVFSSIIKLSSDLKMVGASSSNASLAECKDGAIMQNHVTESGNFSYSFIDGVSAGTVFIVSQTPGPSPNEGGVETYEAAKTGDSITGDAIALIALVALGSFVAMRSRIKNN